MEMWLLLNLIFDILNFFFIYLIVTLSLNLHYGYCGLPNLGLYFSVIGGGIIAAILPGNLMMLSFLKENNLSFIYDNEKVLSLLAPYVLRFEVAVPFFLLSLIIAFLFGASLGLICALPAIRLREDYLAISLICMGEALRIIFYYAEPIARGRLGIRIPNLFAWLGDFLTIGKTAILGLIAGFIFLIINALCNSPYGRLLKAIRENEVTAECVGKNVNKIKLEVLIIGSGFAAIGGFLLASSFAAVTPDAYTRIDWSFWPWLILMVGGMGNNVGIFIGTLLILACRRLLIMSKHIFAPYLPFDVIWLEPILLGILLLLIIAYRPSGILSEKSPRYKTLFGKTNDSILNDYTRGKELEK